MNKMLVALAALGLLVSVGGCSGPLTPSPAEPPKTYATVVELKDAFVKAGGECPDWVQGDRITNAAQSGDCSSSTVLSIYLSEAKRDETIANLKNLSDLGVHLLVGENWIINTEDPETYADLLGGTVVRS